VIFSKHDKNTIYLSLNGYRYNDFKPYVFVSKDNGTNWQDISSNLPLSPVNVIREDINKKQILYVGTDNGVFVSFDSGNQWHPFESTLNRVAVHDLVIQPEKNELLVGTHGRSIYKTKLNVFTHFLNEHNQNKNLTIFKIDDIRHSSSWGRTINYSDELIKTLIQATVYSNQDITLNYSITDKDNNILNQGELKLDKGFNLVEVMPIINTSLNEKKLRKMGLSSRKSDDGNIYLSKGEYRLNISDFSRDFLVK
jgi:hypothetical protein